MFLQYLVFVLGMSMISVIFANPVVGKAHKDQWPVYPTIKYGTGKKIDLIKKGEILVKAGDCIACHTNSNGIPFAGGLPIATPFGTIYTPNITPDKKTGIGNWTTAQFIKAMREGISPKGDYYYPAFPYPYFNTVTTNDLIAIKAYLDALPPVSQPNKPNALVFPFNWRFLQLGWRLLFFHFQKTGPFKPDPTQSPTWNRGKYLVDGLGHCSMCHTPMHYFIKKSWVLGAPDNTYYLAGAMVQGYFAPNITSASFKNTPTSKITSVFLEDKLVGGGNVQGPMDEVNHDSLRYLSKEDLNAIATYLKTVVSKTEPKPPSAGTVSAAAGKAIYDQYCSSCHATGASGAPKFDNKTDWAPRIKQGLPILYKNAIYGIGAMPPKGLCNSCTKVDVQSAVLYMVYSVQGKKITGPTGSTKQSPSAQQLTTVKRGQTVYNQVCSVCHTEGKLGAPKLGDQTAWAPLLKTNMDVLIRRVIKGYKGHPPMGACFTVNGKTCTEADVIAATKYMMQIANPQGNYSLW